MLCRVFLSLCSEVSMATNLPTDLLRSFVAIVDAGSMLRATERILLSQSALSLQMRRLEKIIRVQIFHRHGRKLTLTPAGQHLLHQARQILDLNDRILSSLVGEPLSGTVHIGLVQDFAETLLSSALGVFAAAHPEVQLQVRVADSQSLMDALRDHHLDVVLSVLPDEEDSTLRRAPLVWIGEPELTKQEILPLALLEMPCLFRSIALRALEATGRRFRIVVETPSLSGLSAAVQAGLGVTCRTSLFAETATIPVISKDILPPLPHVSYALHTAKSPTAPAKRIADLIRTAVSDENARNL